MRVYDFKGEAIGSISKAEDRYYAYVRNVSGHHSLIMSDDTVEAEVYDTAEKAKEAIKTYHKRLT